MRLNVSPGLNFLGEELPSKFFGSPQVQHRNWFDHLSLGFLSIILPSQVSATDVLKAMGAMLSGFRSTTLGKMAKEGKLLGISALISKYNSRY